MEIDFDELNAEFSRYYNSDPKPGKILISTPILKDSNFKKTVVLICDVNEEGIFGLIVNRTLQMSLADAFHEVSGWDSPLYIGGPVQKNALSFLHNQYSSVKGSKSIAPGLAWGGHFEDLEESITKRDKTDVVYKFFVGYSGWQHGQLEFEIKQKTWFVCDLKKELIFEGDGVEVWNKAVMSLGEKYKLLLKYPDHPDLN